MPQAGKKGTARIPQWQITPKQPSGGHSTHHLPAMGASLCVAFCRGVVGWRRCLRNLLTDNISHQLLRGLSQVLLSFVLPHGQVTGMFLQETERNSLTSEVIPNPSVFAVELPDGLTSLVGRILLDVRFGGVMFEGCMK